MWSPQMNAVCRRAFVLVLLLVSGVPGAKGRRGSSGLQPPPWLRGDDDDRTDVGHGVAEGNGPNGLYGFFGCLFSYEVCQEDEVCVNDDLFGSCQRIGSPVDRYKYSLSEDQVEKLAYEVEQLVADGYKWRDVYTQCVLGNVLLAFELNQHYDSDFCKHRSKLMSPKGQPSDDDVMFAAKKFYWKIPRELEGNVDRDYDDDPVSGLVKDPYREIYARSPSDSQDPDGSKWSEYDFVNVHKYQKNRKRDPLGGQMTRHSRLPHQRRKDLLTRLTPNELDFLSRVVKMNYEDRDRSNADVDDDDGGNGDDGDADNDDDGYYVGNTGYRKSRDNENSLIFQLSDDQEEKQDDYDQFVNQLLDSGLRLKTKNIYDDLILQQGGEQGDDHSANRDNVLNSLEEEEEEEKRSPDPLSEEVDRDEVDRLANKYMFGDFDDRNDNSYEANDIFWQPTSNSPGETPLVDNSDPTLNNAETFQSPDTEMPSDLKPNLEQISNSDVSSVDKELREARGAVVISSVATTTPKAKYDIVDASYAYLSVLPKTDSIETAGNIITELQELLHLPWNSFSDLSIFKGDLNFRINRNPRGLNASSVAASALSLSNELKNRTGFQVVGAGVGHISDTYISVEDVKTNGRKYFLLTFILCGVIAGVVLAVILLYVIRRHRLSREKLARLAHSTEKVEPEVSRDYQELCRHHMQTKLSEKPEPLHVASRIGSVSATENAAVHSPSSRSSTSSWSEEPVTTSMDISTGHIVLSYMEDHLKNKDRLDEEWDALCAYEPEICSVKVASLQQNERKNRYGDILPYDHSRVILHAATNMTGSDYINASTITDHDPRNPAYLVTQGPLPNTVADFWQMVWEQGSVVIVNLTRLTEQGNSLCHCYWPSEGSDLYHIYEVHLVSEHIWCEDYLVRSFYLRNLQTNETRTVTQFHFQTWPDMKIPGSSKALLDFRRKVNKSYRGRSCPILVHCSDGAGRSGTYCLIDMVLNRMTKGAKEIDIAATLEHIRDQRMQMVKTKEQLQFVLATVAEEVHAILKALPQ